MSELVERLRKVESSRDDCASNITTNWYRNPDGPEAAARIEELEAALRAVSHVKPCGYVDGMDPLEQAQHYARQVLGKRVMIEAAPKPQPLPHTPHKG